MYLYISLGNFYDILLIFSYFLKISKQELNLFFSLQTLLLLTV